MTLEELIIALDAERNALDSESVEFKRRLDYCVQQSEAISARVQIIRRATATLAGVTQKIDAAVQWQVTLTAWRDILFNELAVMPQSKYQTDL
jgi:hypothetical protein